MTQAAPEPARDDMPPVTIENDSENPAPPVNGTSIIDGDDALAVEWIADEFAEAGALAEGIRSLARAAYRAAPENRRKAFEAIGARGRRIRGRCGNFDCENCGPIRRRGRA